MKDIARILTDISSVSIESSFKQRLMLDSVDRLSEGEAKALLKEALKALAVEQRKVSAITKELLRG